MTHRSSVLACSLILVVSCRAMRAADPPVLKIGVQFPASGERAQVGKLMLSGLQMAVDDVNRRAGAQDPKFTLVLSDDESTPEGAVRSLDKLLHDPDVIAIAGEINSPLVLAGAALIDKEGLAYLTAGSSPRTTVQSPWIFRVGASDALLADFLTQYIADELHVKTIAILHDKSGIHNQRAESIAGILKEKYQITSLVDATWNSGDRQFAAQLDQVKAANPQAILALGETPEGGAFFRQVKASGVRAQVIGQRDFGVPRAIGEAGGAAEGALIFTEYAPGLQEKATRDWNAAYNRLNGTDANVIAAQYYDAVQLIAAAVKTGGATRGGVKSGLEQLKGFPGVVADYTFDASRNGVHRFYVAKITGDRLVLVKVLTEEPAR